MHLCDSFSNIKLLVDICIIRDSAGIHRRIGPEAEVTRPVIIGRFGRVIDGRTTVLELLLSVQLSPQSQDVICKPEVPKQMAVWQRRDL